MDKNKMDTVKSNTFGEKQYPVKEAEPLCESIELSADFLMKSNDGMPENEGKKFGKKKKGKNTQSPIREKHAYMVWLFWFI